jgi:hypothetical protein
MTEQVKLNRATRRWAMRKTTVMPVQVIRENNVAVAYLHPTQGWIGNKKAVERAGYHYKKRKTIG